MFKKLWLKFALIFVSIALGAVLLVSLLVNYSFSRQFEGYLKGNQEARLRNIVAMFKEGYKQEGCWDQRWMAPMMRWATMMGTHVHIIGANGEMITPSGKTDPLAPAHRPGTMMHHHKPMMHGGGQWRPNAKTGTTGHNGRRDTRYPIIVDQQQVGTVYVTPAGSDGVWEKQDRSFKGAINDSLLAAAVSAGILAFLLSIWMARRLTRPLREMTQVAQVMERGELNQRVSIRSRDEIGRLGKAFNHLASRLQKQEKLRKTLTANLAHELRTPLATIQSYIEAFQDGVWAADERNMASVYEEVQRLTRLVDDLEALSAAESSYFTLDKKEVDLRELVEKVLAKVKPLFEEKGVSLAFVGENIRPKLRIDTDRVSQILLNLLSNALKFTPGDGKVTISLKKTNGELRIGVKDTGMGIPEEDLPYIFERFYRGKKGRSGGVNGSGIGLTIARELAEAHGGRIQVQSVVGQGSEFTLVLPANDKA